MLRAVVDIGSNSTRLLIAELNDGRIERELERRSTVTRLGAGVDANGRLGGEAMDRVFRTLDEYRKLIDAHQPSDAIAVLTSAVRDAVNGQEFAEEVAARYALKPHVLTGDQEAALTFLGATSERDPEDDTVTLVIDVGGGSTELVTGVGRTPTFHASTQAGVVRQTERHIHHDPPDAHELQELTDDIDSILDASVPSAERRAASSALGVAGTATSLGAIAQKLEPYDPQKVHGYKLSVTECERILARLAALPLDRRRQVPGLHPDRAPTIVAGVIILLRTLALFGLQEFEVSEHDILRGALLGISAEQGQK